MYSCVEDKMYTGRKGRGAFCNGQKLQVSQQEGGLSLAFLLPLMWRIRILLFWDVNRFMSCSFLF